MIRFLPSLIAATTILVSVAPIASLPVLAQSTADSAQTAGTIPQSSAVTVAFPAAMQLEVNQQEYPTTLLLAQPILDAAGNVVAPQNSPVGARLKPAQGGVQVIAESLVIGGRVVPIQASSPVIPGRTVTLSSGNEQARQNSPVFGNLFGSLAGFASGGNRAVFDQAGFLGAGVGILAGISSPKTTQVVQIPQGSVYVLTLQAPVLVSLAPAAQAVRPSAQFNFKTTQEYSQGLDKILQAYQSGKLSKTQALTVIKAANLYATQLPTPLLPPAGQRQRVHQLFNFAY